MTENFEISPSAQNAKPEIGRTTLFNRFLNMLAERRERESVLTKNELALKRMSDIAHRAKDLLDSPEFKAMERITNNSLAGPDEKDTYVYVASGPDGLSYGINVARKASTDEPYMLEVYTSPSNQENYSSGRDDGYFRFYFHEDSFHQVKIKKGEKRGLVWGNSSIQGDVYLGKETATIIDYLSVDDIGTRAHLNGVSFGGHPSIHLTLNASSRGEDGSYCGPIGKINELWVHGIARARQPVKGHISDDRMDMVPIGDDFNHLNSPFVFDRGKINFQATKTTDKSGKEILVFRFSGIRERFSGDRDNPTIVGPEHQEVALPIDMVDGLKVIDLFERAVDATITACKEKPKLNAKNP